MVIALLLSLQWWKIFLPVCDGPAKTYTGQRNGFQCLLFCIILDPEMFWFGVICMLYCRLGISFKDFVAIVIAYIHRCADIVLVHIFLARIIMAIDSLDNNLIIFSDMPFVWWEFTTANIILCTWCAHFDIHLFSLNLPLSAWYASTWKFYCLHIL